jgi:hypothetical protein
LGKKDRRPVALNIPQAKHGFRDRIKFQRKGIEPLVLAPEDPAGILLRVVQQPPKVYRLPAALQFPQKVSLKARNRLIYPAFQGTFGHAKEERYSR